MSFPNAGNRIRDEVGRWPGVEVRPHRFGGTAFYIGRRELGHVHGDAIMDAPVTRAEHDRLIAEGRARPHHVVPQSGWITIPFHAEADVDQAIAVLRASYERGAPRAEARPAPVGNAD